MNAPTTEPSTAATALTPSPTVGSAVRDYVDRVRGGDVGALPAVLGLLVLCAAFTSLRPVFLTPLNFANLLTQGASITLIAMGLVFVLLLGEIDLSAGFASGVCAAVLATLLTEEGFPWPVAIGAAPGDRHPDRADARHPRCPGSGSRRSS